MDAILKLSFILSCVVATLGYGSCPINLAGKPMEGLDLEKFASGSWYELLKDDLLRFLQPYDCVETSYNLTSPNEMTISKIFKYKLVELPSEEDGEVNFDEEKNAVARYRFLWDYVYR